jgi:hypothetical protein
MRSTYLQSLILISLIVLEVCPGWSSKCKNKQRAIITKKARQSYGFWALHIYSMRSIYLQSFMLISFVVLDLFTRQISKCKNKQRAIISKLGKAELSILWFLSTAHLLNEIYLHTKFHMIPLVVSKLYPGQEQRTEVLTGQ